MEYGLLGDVHGVLRWQDGDPGFRSILTNPPVESRIVEDGFLLHDPGVGSLRRQRCRRCCSTFPLGRNVHRLSFVALLHGGGRLVFASEHFGLLHFRRVEDR